jgi:hypothetical protein
MPFRDRCALPFDDCRGRVLRLSYTEKSFEPWMNALTFGIKKRSPTRVCAREARGKKHFVREEEEELVSDHST